MDPNLETTNLFLGIMAVASALQALIIVGVGIGAFVGYRRLVSRMAAFEERHIEPAMTRMMPFIDSANDVLADVKHMTATMKNETDRVDQAVNRTLERVDDTVGRVKTNVRHRTSWVVGVFKGARVALEHVLQH